MVMQQVELFAIPSPCRRICETDSRGYCRGCMRSRDERFNWLRFDDGQKREVLRLCQQRRQRLMAAMMAARGTSEGEPNGMPQLSLFEEAAEEGVAAADD